ncbi:uncharacterized protein LOC111337051 isoform X1 [Stylophora pistillata]|uniref:uncharacterized protein LOC111337051 isoform X1 n=1 Tax=Stylophora pistillata TaxID=50429 RepID=UPI000C055AEA|nr:uncharacterized protein LOC111337051 isoform X1 [Stylophora pistillata]
MQETGLLTPSPSFPFPYVYCDSQVKTRSMPTFMQASSRLQLALADHSFVFVVKQGTPSDDELEHLAVKLGGAWKKLGRRLGIKDPKLEEICQSNEALSEKGYQMLRHWKGVNGSAATYQILGQALQTKLVNLRNLAEEFCYEKQQLEM